MHVVVIDQSPLYSVRFAYLSGAIPANAHPCTRATGSQTRESIDWSAKYFALCTIGILAATRGHERKNTKYNKACYSSSVGGVGGGGRIQGDHIVVGGYVRLVKCLSHVVEAPRQYVL